VDVAEHAIALIMASARRLINARDTLEESSARGEWDFSDLFPLYRMEGKVVGIVGLGRIGKLVARKLQSFGFELIATDPYIEAGGFEEAGGQQADLDTLLGKADYITIHTPLNSETRHLVNESTLKKMKKSAVVINTARGPIVDTEALAQALESETIAGAAIDVYDTEPPPQKNPLFNQKKAILTPHISWASAESSRDIRKRIVEDILSYVEGGNAANIINDVRFKESQV
jgi:D-3-phosphoglycerate dehydrogenase